MTANGRSERVKKQGEPETDLKRLKEEARRGDPERPAAGGRKEESAIMNSEPIDRIRLLAERGDAQAQIQLGSRYYEGRGVGRSESEAAAWFAKAARQGDLNGVLLLGDCYLGGKGVEQDLVMAARLYKKAEKLSRAKFYDRYQISSLRMRAELGDPESQSRLGEYCLNRPDHDGDRAEGIKWLTLAAQQNHAEACLYLGDCYRTGLGVERDEAEAVRLYRLAAKRGLSRAKHALGNSYYTGRGVEKDLKEAVRWFRRAADQGLAASQFALGELHYHGIGVRRDAQTAVRYYRRASRHRWLQSGIVSKARCKLGLCYVNGKGVLRNEFESAKWFVKAIEEGNEEAAGWIPKLRLTPEQKDWLFYRRTLRTECLNGAYSTYYMKG